jgi:hypothetical protein
MTVPASYEPSQITGNGATTVFPYGFPILAAEDLQVSFDGVVQTDGYTVSGVGELAGGDVEFTDAPGEGVVVGLRRAMAIKRETDFQNLGDLRSDALNADQDAPIMMLQQLLQRIIEAEQAIGTAIDYDTQVNILLVSQEFQDLITQLIQNTFYETDITLQLGSLRFLIPLKSITGTVATVDKTYESSLTRCTNAAPCLVTIRENDGTEDEDFSNGAFMSFRQTTVGGQITLAKEDATDFIVPYGFLPKTRAIGSIITATCELADGAVWVLSGDLAVDPSASVGQACNVLESVGGVLTIDCSLGDYFTIALAENITSILFTNLPDEGYAQHLRIRIRQNSSSAKTVAWPASFKWVGGAPVVSVTLSAYDYLSITTFDQGTRWEGALSKGFA